MKNIIVAILLLLLVSGGKAQNAKYELPVRNTPRVNKEKISEANYVTDLSPLLWSTLAIPTGERYYLEHRKINEEGPQRANYIYPQEKYKLTIDYVAVEISTISGCKTLTSKSTSDKLTDEQKNILNSADLGTDIAIKVKFKYKNQAKDEFGSRNKAVEGATVVEVVPETEAEYPGGFKQLSDYFVANVLHKLPDEKARERMMNAEVKFTINEEGEITDVKISRSSTDAGIDQLILQATGNMPKWKPAATGKGIKVKQEICIPFAVGC